MNNDRRNFLSIACLSALASPLVLSAKDPIVINGQEVKKSIIKERESDKRAKEIVDFMDNKTWEFSTFHEGSDNYSSYLNIKDYIKILRSDKHNDTPMILINKENIDVIKPLLQKKTNIFIDNNCLDADYYLFPLKPKEYIRFNFSENIPKDRFYLFPSQYFEDNIDLKDLAYSCSVGILKNRDEILSKSIFWKNMKIKIKNVNS